MRPPPPGDVHAGPSGRRRRQGHPRADRPPAPDGGTVTAEVAAALPALVLVLAVSLCGVVLAGAKLACVDAARAGVRAASRGEPLPAVRTAVTRALPAGARVMVRRDGTTARVDVAVTMRIPLGGGLPLTTVRASAVGRTETGDAGDPFGPLAAEPEGAAHADTR